LKLKEPIGLADGRKLVTLADVRQVILELPETFQQKPCWIATAELLLQAAGEGVDRARLQLYLLQALASERMLASQMRATNKKPRRAKPQRGEKRAMARSD
jgi:hypothetical protein